MPQASTRGFPKVLRQSPSQARRTERYEPVRGRTGSPCEDGDWDKEEDEPKADLKPGPDRRRGCGQWLRRVESLLGWLAPCGRPFPKWLENPDTLVRRPGLPR